MATVMQRSAEAQRRLWKAEKLAPADVDKMLDDIQDQRDDMQELSERLADTGGDDYADAMCQEVTRVAAVLGARVPAQRCGAYALSARAQDIGMDEVMRAMGHDPGADATLAGDVMKALGELPGVGVHARGLVEEPPCLPEAPRGRLAHME